MELVRRALACPAIPPARPRRPRRAASVLARVRSLMLVLMCLLYVASWPGSTLRELAFEQGPVLAPVPTSIRERDGALDVVVHARGELGDAGAAPAPGPPLAGAEVRAFAVLDGKAFAAGKATTDEAGVARLEGLAHAEHWIVAEAKGRARASQMVVVVAGARRLDLELGPEHALEVRVRTETGEAVPGAELEVRGADPFPIGRAPTPRASRASHGSARDRGSSSRARTASRRVTRRRVPEGQPLVVTLGRQGALVVKVVSETGEPTPGARVLVASPSLFPARVAETTEKGSVRIGGLAPGSYALRAVRGGRVSPIEVGVPVGKGEEREVELRLGPGVTVAARVIDATSREPVPSARLTLVEGGSRRSRSRASRTSRAASCSAPSRAARIDRRAG